MADLSLLIEYMCLESVRSHRGEKVLDKPRRLLRVDYGARTRTVGILYTDAWLTLFLE